MRRSLVVPALCALSLACAASTPPVAASARARNPLACAGHTLESSVAIPELGRLPSGAPVTAGTTLRCGADTLEILDWGPDSAASYVIPRGHAMELWTAFQAPGTLEERHLRVLLLLERARAGR